MRMRFSIFKTNLTRLTGTSFLPVEFFSLLFYFSQEAKIPFLKQNHLKFETTEPAKQLWDIFELHKSDHKPWLYSLDENYNALIANVLMKCRETKKDDGTSYFNNGHGKHESDEQYAERRIRTENEIFDVLASDPSIAVFLLAEGPVKKEHIELMKKHLQSKNIPGWEHPVFLTERDEKKSFGLITCFKNGPIAKAFQLNEKLATEMGELAIRCQTFRASASYQISNVHVPHDKHSGYSEIIILGLHDVMPQENEIKKGVLYLQKKENQILAYSTKMNAPVIFEIEKCNQFKYDFKNITQSIVDRDRVREIVKAFGFAHHQFLVMTSKEAYKKMIRLILKEMMLTLTEDGFNRHVIVNDKNMTPEDEIAILEQAYPEVLEELKASGEWKFPVSVIVRLTPSVDGHIKLVSNEGDRKQKPFTVDSAVDILVFKSDKDQFRYLPPEKASLLFGLLAGGSVVSGADDVATAEVALAVYAGYHYNRSEQTAETVITYNAINPFHC